MFEGVIPVLAGTTAAEAAGGGILAAICVGSGACELIAVVAAGAAVGAAIGAGGALIYRNITGGGKTGQKVNVGRVTAARKEIAEIAKLNWLDPTGTRSPTKRPMIRIELRN